MMSEFSEVFSMDREGILFHHHHRYAHFHTRLTNSFHYYPVLPVSLLLSEKSMHVGDSILAELIPLVQSAQLLHVLTKVS